MKREDRAKLKRALRIANGARDDAYETFIEAEIALRALRKQWSDYRDAIPERDSNKPRVNYYTGRGS
jgi:hypothetical protein